MLRDIHCSVSASGSLSSHPPGQGKLHSGAEAAQAVLFRSAPVPYCPITRTLAPSLTPSPCHCSFTVTAVSVMLFYTEDELHCSLPVCVQVKCDQYWPSRGTETYGMIQVTMLDTVELATYSVRTFTLYKVRATHVEV